MFVLYSNCARTYPHLKVKFQINLKKKARFDSQMIFRNHTGPIIFFSALIREIKSIISAIIRGQTTYPLKNFKIL